MEDLSLADILAIFKRRRKLFLVTFSLVFALALVFALRYSHYRATATIEIDQPYISNSVTAVGNDAQAAMGLADRRISQIQQTVMGVESLNAIIKKLNLYPGANTKLAPERLAAIMRSKVRLDFVSSVVANPQAVQKESVEQLSAIAFNLSFDYNDPKMAKQALDEIVAHFIAEEANQRQTASKETSAFLDEQAKVLEAEIKEQENKLAEFRGKYGDSGPSAMMFNQQASMSNMMNLQSLETQISSNQALLGQLRGQLATIDPYAPLVEEDGKMLNSPVSQLKTLQAQYASLTGKYGPEHPDVVKVRDQIAALKAQKIGKHSLTSINREADNPAYIQLSAQLSAAEAEQKSLLTQRETLKAQKLKYDQTIAANPQIEQQASQLSLDLDNAKERYRAIKEKKLQADMKQTLESGKNSERLKVMTPAMVPDTTTPKRSLLIIGGLFMALMSGLGMVVLMEAFTQTVRGANHLASIVGAAPLVSIPHIHAKV